jgi:hypothetical protein
MNRFIDHLYTQVGTTSNYSAIANLHTLQIATEPAKKELVFQWKAAVFRSELKTTDCPETQTQNTILRTRQNYVCVSESFCGPIIDDKLLDFRELSSHIFSF